jgi:triosephosphate isomerase
MKLLIVANWKMNPSTLKGAKLLFNSVKKKLKSIKNVEVVICPPFIYLSILRSRMKNLKLGAQNMFYEIKGAYTGEISPVQLSDLGCKYVIVGHSEREKYFAETDKTANRKIKAAIRAKLDPIFCIGESREEREKGQTSSVLKSQIEKGLKKISQKHIKRITIAYEPTWAIGTGNPCDIEEAQKMRLLIRKIMARKYSLSAIKGLKILYGGSVNSKNALGYIKEAGLQGFVVGGASLDPEEFVKILKIIS